MDIDYYEYDYLSFEKPIAELQAKIDELSLVDGQLN